MWYTLKCKFDNEAKSKLRLKTLKEEGNNIFLRKVTTQMLEKYYEPDFVY